MKINDFYLFKNDQLNHFICGSVVFRKSKKWKCTFFLTKKIFTFFIIKNNKLIGKKRKSFHFEYGKWPIHGNWFQWIQICWEMRMIFFRIMKDVKKKKDLRKCKIVQKSDKISNKWQWISIDACIFRNNGIENWFDSTSNFSNSNKKWTEEIAV